MRDTVIDCLLVLGVLVCFLVLCDEDMEKSLTAVLVQKITFALAGVALTCTFHYRQNRYRRK